MDGRNINAALVLLGDIAPEHYAHLVREVTGVVCSSGACGPNGLACTGHYLGRTVVLSADPSHMDLIDLAVLLAHESSAPVD